MDESSGKVSIIGAGHGMFFCDGLTYGGGWRQECGALLAPADSIFCGNPHHMPELRIG